MQTSNTHTQFISINFQQNRHTDRANKRMRARQKRLHYSNYYLDGISCQCRLIPYECFLVAEINARHVIAQNLNLLFYLRNQFNFVIGVFTHISHMSQWCVDACTCARVHIASSYFRYWVWNNLWLHVLYSHCEFVWNRTWAHIYLN